MKKTALTFYYIMLTLFCQAIIFVALAHALPESAPAGSRSETRTEAISRYCESLTLSLKSLQQKDSRIRVYLGRHYESILNNFVIPLNVRLVKNDIPASDLAKVQSAISAAKTNFSLHFIDYQKSLEDLIAIDCKLHPADFDQKLRTVRQNRQAVSLDTKELERLFSEYLNFAEAIKEKL